MTNFKAGNRVCLIDDFSHCGVIADMVGGVYKLWMDNGNVFYARGDDLMIAAEIEPQLVHFWHLQLQFMQMSAFELKTVNYAFWLAEMPIKIKNQHIFWKDFTEEQRMEYATELALKLSGLDNA